MTSRGEDWPLTNHCVVDANRKVLRCNHCGLEIAMPLPIGSRAFGVACRAFPTVHDVCSPGGATGCPVGDPECLQPHPDALNGPHCHDACEALPRTLVGTMARCAGILFEEGDAFQTGNELAEFVMAVAEIARKEAQETSHG